MNIKKILKLSTIYLSPFILIFLLLFCINIIIKDLNYGYRSYNISTSKIDWAKYELEIQIKKINNNIRNFFSFKNKKGLKRVYIQIPEKTDNKLLSNIPSSTKNYYPSSYITNNKIYDVDLRYFTDNPVGWLFHQKAIRFKTKKKDIINRKRYFEFKAAQNNLLGEFVPFIISKNLNLLSSKKNLVELYINGKNNGIYIESERLNESFLRRNKIMPINLYKGEQSNNAENKIGLNNQLFNNPGLWEKVSYFNVLEPSDRSDLSYFFKKVMNSENSKKDMINLLDYGNLKIFSNQEIFQILNQHYIGNDTHNMRLAVDLWSGKVHQIPHDIIFTDSDIDRIKIDWANNHIFRSINQNSHYLDYKYTELYKVLTSKRIIEKTISELDKIKNKFLLSKIQDIGYIQRKYYSDHPVKKENDEYFENFKSILKKRKDNLLKILESQPTAGWNISDNGFAIEVSDILPISNLKIDFKNDEYPEYIVLDVNKNNIEDKNDLYFYPNENGEFLLNMSFYANRIPILKNNINIPYVEIKTDNTKFIFLTVNNNIKKITYENKFSNKTYQLKKKKIEASLTNLHNNIIKNYDEEVTIEFKGNIYIDKDLILNDKVLIKPGTIFHLTKNASIIFKNRVEAIGTINSPISFQYWNKQVSKSKDNFWGTLAIHGEQTKGSKFINVDIKNGSGDIIDNINYFSTLSIHDTSDIILKNLKIGDNNFYDDLVHIIYSKNISVINSKFVNSFSDAIDVDLSSKIYIKNVGIFNSTNDGLDFMESEAIIDNTNIHFSGDKGISVGENSKVEINNSNFENNVIGIASKDLSKAQISNSNFANNKMHLNVYKKNWRYGASGNIVAKNSTFEYAEKNFVSDKKGKILIQNSNFNKNIYSSKNVIFE